MDIASWPATFATLFPKASRTVMAISVASPAAPLGTVAVVSSDDGFPGVTLNAFDVTVRLEDTVNTRLYRPVSVITRSLNCATPDPLVDTVSVPSANSWPSCSETDTSRPGMLFPNPSVTRTAGDPLTVCPATEFWG